MHLLFQYVKEYKKLLFFALLLAAINQFFSLLDPQIFRLIIDRFANRITELTAADFVSGVLLLLAGGVTVAFISRVAKNFQDYYVNAIVQRVGNKLYAHSIQHSFALPYTVFEDQRSGELLQKLQKARTDAQNLITSSINVVFFSLVGIVFVLTYAFFVNWMVGLVYLLLMPLLGFTTYAISKKIRATQKKIIAQTAELAGSTTETIRNVELVKSLGLEQQEVQRLNDVNDRILQLELVKIKQVRIFSFIQGTLINAMRSGLLFLMLWLVFQQDITLGQFFSLYVYSFFIFSPLAEFGNVATQYQEARASHEQLQEVLRLPPEPLPAHPKEIGDLQKVSFNEVSFAYQGQQRDAVSKVSFELTAGQTVAFVGPSGSGKTTILKLLVGLYKPTTGKIVYNDIDGEHVVFPELRKRIGLVSQETQLFAGTIKENLLFVNPQATDEQCMQALTQAAAQAIVQRGEHGLDTKIGEGGIKISGGERQRLAIARALLRDPGLIIFDEATSSLDSLTERSITETIQQIEKRRPNTITVLVAHRLSTIAHADIIYVLEKGMIVERGNHAELLKHGGLYAALWRQQIAVQDHEQYGSAGIAPIIVS